MPASVTYYPYDIAVDPYGRLLYWTCAHTNSINVTRLDNRSAVGVVVRVDGEKPRNIALHPEKGYETLNSLLIFHRYNLYSHENKIKMNTNSILLIFHSPYGQYM